MWGIDDMDFPGFIGPSYQAISINADAQRTINLYPEVVESGDGKSKIILVGTPGLTTFLTLPTSPVRGMWSITGNVYAVAGNEFYLINPNGTYDSLGALLTSTGFVSINDNSLQICITDGPNEYIYTPIADNFSTGGGTWAVNPAAANFQGATNVSFIDSYFVFGIPTSREFLLSALNDGTTINDADIATKEGNSDLLAGTFVDHRQLYVLGGRTIEVWYDTGALTFPFQPIQGVFIEVGCASIWTVCKTVDTILFLSKSQRGEGIIYMLQGFAPVRVSTHAIEQIIESWGSDLSGCSAFVYEEQGHVYYCFNGPIGTSATTLCFDEATQQWHERQWFNTSTSLPERWRAQFHAIQTGGVHLFGDYSTGQIYVSSLTTYTDDSAPIYRTRISPHSFSDLNRVFYEMFQVDLETGVGLSGSGPGSAPLLYMKHSNDGGHNWSSARSASMGTIGNTKARAYWKRCGQARDRVFQVYSSDPVKQVWIGAKLEATAGTN